MGELINGHGSEELWRHPDQASTPMWDFIQRVNKKHGLQLHGYPGLFAASQSQRAPLPNLTVSQ